MAYFEQGLPIVPVGRSDKKPLVRWSPYQRKLPSERCIETWIDKFADENIGIVTGSLSRITVVDIDMPDSHLSKWLERFGDTPFVATTPRGGYHLYYQSRGEPTITQHEAGIDIRGEGGMIVAPPSYGENGVPYNPVSDKVLYLHDLPAMNERIGCGAPPKGKMGIGRRNNALFDFCREHAKGSSHEEELLTKAFEYNSQHCVVPLSDKEVQSTVNSVWRYKEKGRLFGKGEGYVKISDRLWHLSPSGFKVYAYLRYHNNRVGDQFPIGVNGCAKALSMSPVTMRKSIAELVDAGWLIQTHHGGQWKGDVGKYVWVQ